MSGVQVVLQLKEQQATLKVVGVMASSNKVMASMSQLLSVPQIATVSRNMAKEMEKVLCMTPFGPFRPSKLFPATGRPHIGDDRRPL